MSFLQDKEFNDRAIVILELEDIDLEVYPSCIPFLPLICRTDHPCMVFWFTNDHFAHHALTSHW